jgi:hypothetical protein
MTKGHVSQKGKKSSEQRTERAQAVVIGFPGSEDVKRHAESVTSIPSAEHAGADDVREWASLDELEAFYAAVHNELANTSSGEAIESAKVAATAAYIRAREAQLGSHIYKTLPREVIVVGDDSEAKADDIEFNNLGRQRDERVLFHAVDARLLLPAANRPMLTDRVLYTWSKLLQAYFPNIKGLCDPLWADHSGFQNHRLPCLARELQAGLTCAQVIHVHQHYIAVVAFQSEVFVFCSMNSAIPAGALEQIKLLFTTPQQPSITVKQMRTHPQQELECGLRAGYVLLRACQGVAPDDICRERPARPAEQYAQMNACIRAADPLLPPKRGSKFSTGANRRSNRRSIWTCCPRHHQD